jgi:quercetin dioxygenase-like cupin family protein
MRDRPLAALLLACASIGASSAGEADRAPGRDAPRTPYAYATDGVLVSHTPVSLWRVLLDRSNLGGNEMELAELTLKAGTVVPGHVHHSLEVFYVVSGVFGHEVNGHYFLLKPGMVGVARPGDKVRHIVPKGEDAKVLVIWTPGGEVGDIVNYAKGTRVPPVAESSGAP